MKRIAVLMMIAVMSLTTSAHGQSLIGLRIEGPQQVPADSLTLYRVYAEFDNGWEYEVTLDTALWLDPGVHASIGPFGDFHAFTVDGYAVETIFAYYSFGPDYQIATLDVIIVSADIDQDGDIDLDDFAWLNVCLAGPGETTPPGGCTSDMFDRSDLNADICVDASDYAVFQRLFIRVCIDDGDCDDENPCTIDACENGHCVYTLVDCDDGLFCTGEEFCDPATGDCVSPGDPCPPGMVCNEATDECQEGGLTFFFTEGIDQLIGTSGPDTFLGSDDTYTTGDFLSGRGGIDRLNLTTTDDEPDLVDIELLENYFIRNTFGGQVINGSGWTGYDQLWYDRGTEDLTLENVNELATLGITGGDGGDSDYDVEFDDSIVAGIDDALNVILDDADAGDLIVQDEADDDGFETIEVECVGNNTLNDVISADMDTVMFSGEGACEIAAVLNGATGIDASANTGGVDVVVDDENMDILGGDGNDTFTFGVGEFDDDDEVDCGGGDEDILAIAMSGSTDVGTDAVQNCEILSVMGDDSGGTFTLDLAETAGIMTIRMEAITTTSSIRFDNLTLNTTLMFRGDRTDANQEFDNVRILDVVNGDGDSDVLNININNQGEDLDENDRTVTIGTIDIDEIENVSFTNEDGGDVTITTLNGVDVASVVIVSELGDFAITNPVESVNVDHVDGTNVGGDLTVDIDNSTENAQMTGGSGKNTLSGGAWDDTILGGPDEDALTGDAGDDILDGGADDDLLTGGAGADDLIGGEGGDRFIYTTVTDGSTTSDNAGFGALADTIDDFEVDEDLFVIDGGLEAVIDDTAVGTLEAVSVASGDADPSDANDADEVIYINNVTVTDGQLTADNLAAVIAAIGALNFATAADDACIFVIRGANDTGVYLFEAADANNTIAAAEMKLLTICEDSLLDHLDFSL